MQVTRLRSHRLSGGAKPRVLDMAEVATVADVERVQLTNGRTFIAYAIR